MVITINEREWRILQRKGKKRPFHTSLFLNLIHLSHHQCVGVRVAMMQLLWWTLLCNVRLLCGCLLYSRSWR